MNSHSILYGILLLIFGLFLRYHIARRRFNRRSVTGMQIYSSHLRGFVTTIIETLLNGLGMLSILIGLIYILIHL